MFSQHMIPNYKEKMADVIAMLDRQNEIRMKAGAAGSKKQAIQFEEEAKQAVNQQALDEVFASFMTKEY